MINNENKKQQSALFIAIILMIYTLPAFTQWDATIPRYLTRSKLWSTLRMSGLQGQQGIPGSQPNDQADLSYPGSSVRTGEFIAYWNASIVNQSSGGGGAGAMSPNAARNVNSHGEGTFIIGKANGKKLISYSGPRTTSTDVTPVPYDAASGPEADLGIDDAKSTYWPGAPPGDPEEPVEIHNYQYGRYIGRDNEAEEMIIVHWTNALGITGTKKEKAWSYQKYDDFFIVENIFEYTGDSNGDGIVDSKDVFGNDLPVLTDVYFAFANMFMVSFMGHTWGNPPTGSWRDFRGNYPRAQDDHYKYTDSPGYTALIPEDTPNYIGKKMSYGWDGDNPVDNDWNDTGEPYKEAHVQRNTGNEQQGQAENQLLAYAFVGMAPLDYDPSDGFANDDETYVAPLIADQPSREKWWHYYALDNAKPIEPNLMSFTEDQIYDMIATDDPANGDPAIQSDPPRPGDLRNVGSYVHFQIYGPYTLHPGDKVKIVMAYVAGSGADYLANQGVFDPKLAPENAWARSLRPGKMKELEYGEKSLFHNLALAQEIYDMNYDVPDPPPDVLIENVVPNAKAQLQVFWGDEALDAKDPDYSGDEAKDVAGFRVYKMLTGGAAEKADPKEPRNDDKLTGNWHNGPYKFMDEIKRGQLKSDFGLISYEPEIHRYTFVDPETRAGAFQYFYSVRSFDTGHSDWNGTGQAVPSLESGLSAPEQKMMIGKEAYSLASAESDNMKQTIRVVPNPYKIDGEHEYILSNAIKFFNIPQKCTISIYSVSGELVAQVFHNEASPLGEWGQQTIKFAGDVAPGIYFWVVRSEINDDYSYVSAQGDTLPPVHVNSKGKVQKGTLLIIR